MNDTPGHLRLFQALDATWPAAETLVADGWRLRRGAGGGKRVSAASPEARDGDIAVAEQAMLKWDQPPLFRLLPDDTDLDGTLQHRGYRVIDPVVIYAAPAALLDDGADETARVIRVSTPLALMAEIWDAGGIGPARRAVMARARGPRIDLMARVGDRPAGAAFVAIDGDVAMIHAIEVMQRHRRRGAARLLMKGAASFALENGAAWLALAVTEANAPARSLYAALGMAEAGRYHYRIHPDHD